MKTNNLQNDQYCGAKRLIAKREGGIRVSFQSLGNRPASSDSSFFEFDHADGEPFEIKHKIRPMFQATGQKQPLPPPLHLIQITQSGDRCPSSHCCEKSPVSQIVARGSR